MRSLSSRHRNALIEATVRVLTTGGVSGTGFFVAPNRVVTCAHVVPDGGEYTVLHRGTPHAATVLVREPQQGAEQVFAYPDVALLEVDVPEPDCVPLGTGMPEPGRLLYAYGCPLIDGRPVWDHLSLVSEGEQTPDGTTHTFLKTKDSQVRSGASGSGAVDVRTGELVGMLAQTRDPTLDLGGALVPVDTIVATLRAAGHDISGANCAATAEASTVANARRRLRFALQTLINELDMTRPEHLRSMLMTLRDEPLDEVDLYDVAFALLGIQLDDLGDALRELARASHSAEVPRRLLDGAASFAWLSEHRLLVEPATANQLAAERKQQRPRVVHLPVVCPRSIGLHANRAAVDRRWRAVELTPLDAETDPVTGLPAWLVRAVRCQLLDEAGVDVDPDSPESIDSSWAARGERARRRAGDLLLVLPARVADAGLVEALRREFAPCLFVLAGTELSERLRDDPALLSLPPSLATDEEREADRRYAEIGRGIERDAR